MSASAADALHAGHQSLVDQRQFHLMSVSAYRLEENRRYRADMSNCDVATIYSTDVVSVGACIGIDDLCVHESDNVLIAGAESTEMKK